MYLSRRSFLKAGALAAAGICGAGLPAAAASGVGGGLRGPVRPTCTGPVEGTAAGQPEGVLVWYSLPYGAPPTGSLRWQPPQPAGSWSGVLDCTVPGLAAIQPCNGAVNGAEDCLRLDIYAPDGASGLPVAVYFHGGDGCTGSPRELPGGPLAAGAECVVVGVRTRLGLLGWNSLPALTAAPDATGNYALLDAARAFDWVAENIASFGGDPGNVTAFGFSAGARSVLAMLASPCFAGRFQRAAAFSGGLTTASPDAGARQAVLALAPLAVEDGLFAENSPAAAWLLTDGEDVRRWLYGLEPARLCLAAQGGGDLRMENFPHLFADGVLLPRDGFGTKLSNPVPLLLATGQTEFSLFNPLPAWYEAQGLSRAETAAARRFANACGSDLYRDFNGAGCAAALTPCDPAPIWLCEIAYGGPDSPSPLAVLGLGSYHGICLPLLTGENNLAGAAALNGAGFAAMGRAFTGFFRAFLRGEGPGWAAWTPGAPRAMVLDADDAAGRALTDVRDLPAAQNVILGRLASDNGLSPAALAAAGQALRGRFFSTSLDAHFAAY